MRRACVPNGHDAAAAVELSLGGASDAACVPLQVNLGGADDARRRFREYPSMSSERYARHVWLGLYPPGETKIEQALDRCLNKLGKEDLTGKLVVVDEDKIRVRG